MMAIVSAIKQIDFGCSYWPNGMATLAKPLRDRIVANYQPTWDLRSLCRWRIGHGPLQTSIELRDELEAKRASLQQELDQAVAG